MNHVICINKLGISLIIKCLEIKPLMYKTEQSWKSSEISLWQIIFDKYLTELFNVPNYTKCTF